LTKRSAPNRAQIAAALFLAISGVHAQDAVTIDYEAVRRNNVMPSDERLDDALKARRPEIERALNTPLARPPVLPEPAKPTVVPDVRVTGRAISTPPAPKHLLERPTNMGTLDLGSLAKAYASASSPMPSGFDGELLVFVSFSIPPPELRKLIESADEAKAVVVFRGPVDESDTSMRKFASRIRALGLRRAGDIQVNPPAFTKYRIEQVPSFVVATLAAGASETDGCAPVSSYASVDGLISPEYALNIIKSRARPDIAAMAARYLDAIKAKRQ
jgi:conjugal transfer pilus assembly protein TrbC